MIESKDKKGHNSMHSIHQAKLKSGHLLHKMTLVQSQRKRTVNSFTYLCNAFSMTIETPATNFVGTNDILDEENPVAES